MDSATGAMDVNAEAKRILAVSISKLYASRSQRGGLRLHRSLLLSLVMRSARDIYHSACARAAAEEQPMEEPQAAAEEEEQQQPPPPPRSPVPGGEEEEEEEEEAAEDKENRSPAGRESRKRRGKVSAAPDFLPSKRARLEPGEERHAAPLLGCRAGPESLAALSLNRAIPAC